MIRLVVYIGLSLVLTLAIAWLIATPGTIRIDVGGYRLQPGIGVTAVALVLTLVTSIFLWTLFSRLLSAPRMLAKRAARKSRDKGVDALSDGFIALQAGDAEKARKLARDARNRLPKNAAAHLLQARAELALGQWGAAREHYRALIDNPKTALAALSGLYEQARAQNRDDAALTFAHKAHALAPALTWAGEAVFDDIVRRGDWAAGLEMVEAAPATSRSGKAQKKRKQAVLHTAIAADAENTDPLIALEHTRTALKLEPDFVPAALIAARIHSSRGETRKGTSLLRRVWRATHHPHVATLFANAQPGISPTQRLKRLRELVPSPPPDAQSAIVLARIAIEAQEWSIARNALANFASANPSQATCVAMARIEEGQNDDFGRARQWLARAVTAPRDPIWTADGITAEEWAPVSPVSGTLDAFEWKVPTNAVALSDDAELNGFEDEDLAISEEATLLPPDTASLQETGGQEREEEDEEGVKAEAEAEPAPAVGQKSTGN